MHDLIYLDGLMRMFFLFAALISFLCVCEKIAARRKRRRQEMQVRYIAGLHRRMALEDRALERELGGPLHMVPRQPLSSYSSKQLEAMAQLRRQTAAAQRDYGTKAQGESCPN